MQAFIHGDVETEAFWFHPDHLGSSNYITNINGTVSQHMEYFAFGETFVEEHKNSHNSPYKFNGKELDEETGNYYYGARYYNPRTSIWLSVDPLANVDYLMNNEAYLNGEHNGGVFNHFNLNSYGYCYGNPVIYIDPNGKQVASPYLGGEAWYWSKRTNNPKLYEGYKEYRKYSDAGTLVGIGIWAGAAAVYTYGWKAIGTFFAKEAAEEGLSVATNGWSDVLDITKLAYKGIKYTGKTVLGHVEDRYQDLAKELDASVFHFEDDVWDELVKKGVDLKAANNIFIDEAIKKGDDFILSRPGYKVREGSALESEIKRIFDSGKYKWADETQTKLIPKN